MHGRVTTRCRRPRCGHFFRRTATPAYPYGSLLSVWSRSRRRGNSPTSLRRKRTLARWHPEYVGCSWASSVSRPRRWRSWMSIRTYDHSTPQASPEYRPPVSGIGFLATLPLAATVSISAAERETKPEPVGRARSTNRAPGRPVSFVLSSKPEVPLAFSASRGRTTRSTRRRWPSSTVRSTTLPSSWRRCQVMSMGASRRRRTASRS